MLVVTHGAGGGALTGGAVNRNERFAYLSFLFLHDF
jgi:hypothetical protein